MLPVVSCFISAAHTSSTFAKDFFQEVPILKVYFSYQSIAKFELFWNFDRFLQADMTKRETLKLGSSLIQNTFIPS